jgi:hypothetical protein
MYRRARIAGLQMTPPEPAQIPSKFWRRGLLTAICVIAVADSIAYAHKVSEGRSAFLRWQPQVIALSGGENIHRTHAYPNPPIMALVLYPFAVLPVFVGAMAFYALKFALAGVSLFWALRLAGARNEPGQIIVAAAALALTLRPLLEDLQHGNVNIVVGCVLLGALDLYRRRRDAASGLMLGLAVSMKVTPALLIAYFLYKRKWRVIAGSGAGIALFLVIVPGVWLGFDSNLASLNAWFDTMIRPYAIDGRVLATSQLNQSLPGILNRLLTDVPGLRIDGVESAVNWLALDPAIAGRIVRVVSLGLIGWLVWVCRDSTVERTDVAQAIEFSLVLIAMLLVSERSWKAHFVTMLLPYTTAAAWLWARGRTEPELQRWKRFDARLRATLLVAFVLMLSTAKDVTGWLYWSQGERVAHKYAEAYGMFGLSAVLMFAALSALRVRLR